MRTYTVQGIILKRKNVGEADRLLTVFTREQGKMQIKAKGVRRIASKRASYIEPLNIASLTLYKGTGMPILTEATSLESFPLVKNDLQKIGIGYHICELIDGLCPENQESNEVFSLIEKIFKQLSIEQEIGVLVHAFEVELLSLLGYWSAGAHDLTGAKASFFIESILERKLKSRQILPSLAS